MKLVLSFIFWFGINDAVSQTVNRKILDKQTKLPVSYATVKVLHAPKGVIASNEGEFELNIDAEDSVLFSCVGYQQKILTGKEIGTEIYLEPKIKVLENVTVKEKKWIRTIVLGNTDKKIKWDENWGPGVGCKEEFAQKFQFPDSFSYRVKKIFIPVKKNHVGWGPLLLHIYASDPVSDYPGEEILLRPVFLSKENVDGYKAIIDISTENLVFHGCESFFVSVGWIDDNSGANGLTTILMSRSSKATTYTRHLCQSNYRWYAFGIMKDRYGVLYEIRTIYSIEVDEMK